MAGRRSASGGSGSPRRPAQYAWFITGPLMFLAVVFSMTIGLVTPNRPHPSGSWGLAAVLLGVMVIAGLPMLNFVIGRQSFGVPLVEIPLVPAFFFLPPLTVVLVYTLSALITHLRHRFGAAKLVQRRQRRCRRIAGRPRAAGAAAGRGGRAAAPGACSSRPSAPSRWSACSAWPE